MIKDLYIVGAGGFGREVAWLVERINEREKEWNLKGFLDDNEALHGTIDGGYPILGGCNYLEKISNPVWVVCAVGAAKTRHMIVEKIRNMSNISFATLIDPNVVKSNRVVIGEGSIICAGTIVTVDINIGKHVIINLDCTIGHDAVIEDFVTVYPSVNVSGNTVIGMEVELGTGMQIIQGKKIGKQSIVGAGAVVVRDIPERCTAVGSPAKPIKFWD